MIRTLIVTLYTLGFVSLFQIAPTVQSSVTPMPHKIGRMTIAWEVQNATRWEVIGCPLMDRCTMYGNGTGGQKRGSLEVSPQIGERFYLNTWNRGEVTTHLLVEIPKDWMRRWVVLPVVKK